MEKWANGSLGGQRAEAVQLGNALGALEWEWEREEWGGCRELLLCLNGAQFLLWSEGWPPSASCYERPSTFLSLLKVLDSRSHLPDNCCTEGWSCVLNNCAWMVSTTLLKRRLGPARRQEAQVAVRAMGAKPTHMAAREGSQASALQSYPQECPDCVSVLQPKGLCCAGLNRRREGFRAPFVKTEKVCGGVCFFAATPVGCMWPPTRKEWVHVSVRRKKLWPHSAQLRLWDFWMKQGASTMSYTKTGAQNSHFSTNHGSANFTSLGISFPPCISNTANTIFVPDVLAPDWIFPWG